MFVFPAIDVLDGTAVRLLQGDYNHVTVYNWDVVAQAADWVDGGAKWLHMVDLDGARSGLPANLAYISAVATRFPDLMIQVGGGIRNQDSAQRLLDAGVSRVIFGTALVTDFEKVGAIVETLGSERVVAGIDARDGLVATEGWRAGSSIEANALAKELSAIGIRHLVFTDIARDGAQTGIDTEAYRHIADAAGFPVIVSGGVTSLADIEAVRELGETVAEGVIVGRALYEKNFTLPQAIEMLKG